jgi:flagellar hook-associated protein 1 FlgK
MANMLGIGISGLNAAQVALNTVGNNLANVDTAGYDRQTVVQVERIGQSNGRLTVGAGVDVVSVQRQYSQYLTNSVWNSNSSLQRADTFNDLTTTLNGALAGSGNLQGALDDFYGAFSTVAGAPSDSSTRQAMLGDTSKMVSMFNTLASQFTAQQRQVNTQISNTVDSINDLTKNIASLNQQISQAGPNGAPNSLLDQRDSLVGQLSGYVGVSTVQEKDGTISLYSTSGQALVSGNESFALGTAKDPYDATRTNVTDAAGNDITSKVSGGSLGALIDYRSSVLDPAQNQLGQAAQALASSVNAQQAKGLDLNGKLGSPILSIGGPDVMGSSANTSNATMAASISDTSKLGTSDYIISYDGTAWSMRTTGGQNVPLTDNGDGTLSGAGLTFTPSTAPPAQAGDSFKIQPTRNAASTLAVAMTDPSGIAAASALVTTADKANTGTGAIGSTSVTDPTNTAVLDGATITFTSPTAYSITDPVTGTTTTGTYTAGQPITVNGMSVTLSGAPAAGDKFTVAANTNGLNDNGNALDAAKLADTGVLDGGKTSVLDAYGNLTTQIGSAGSQAASNLATQTSLNNQAVAAQQSLSGVNQDEEAANLVKYQQSYQAAAQVISAAQTIFTSLINAVQS